MNIAAWLALPAGMLAARHRAEAWEETERRDMVAGQLAGQGITCERVLAAMARVPRHEFVPAELKRDAYRDGPLPIGHGQTISQPHIVALMTELLAVRPESRVLEIGTGSGYQTAVLAELVSDVYTVEIVPPLSLRALETLDRLGYRNVHGKVGDGHLGCPEEAPFDAIIVTCAPDDVPPELIGQLSQGGRLVAPVGNPAGTQQLLLLEKTGGQIQQTLVIPVRFVPMVHGIR